MDGSDISRTDGGADSSVSGSLRAAGLGDAVLCFGASGVAELEASLLESAAGLPVAAAPPASDSGSGAPPGVAAPPE